MAAEEQICFFSEDIRCKVAETSTNWPLKREEHHTQLLVRSILKGFKVDLSFILNVMKLHLEDLQKLPWARHSVPTWFYLADPEDTAVTNKNVFTGIFKVSHHFYEEIRQIKLQHIKLSCCHETLKLWKMVYDSKMSHFMDVIMSEFDLCAKQQSESITESWG